MQIFDERLNLASEIATAVRAMILNGQLPAGERVNEVRLASQLGVSRTPLREALSRLVNEGALRDEPRRGVFVRALTAEEVRAIYPIRAILDPAALRLAGIPDSKTIAELRAINAQLARSADPETAVRLDDEFHLRLVSACPNAVLLDLIRQFMWRTRRYELGLMRSHAPMADAVAVHDRILAALEAGDLECAIGELEGNMARGAAPVLAWLAERDRTAEEGDK